MSTDPIMRHIGEPRYLSSKFVFYWNFFQVFRILFSGFSLLPFDSLDFILLNVSINLDCELSLLSCFIINLLRMKLLQPDPIPSSSSSPAPLPGPLYHPCTDLLPLPEQGGRGFLETRPVNRGSLILKINFSLVFENQVSNSWWCWTNVTGTIVRGAKVDWIYVTRTGGISIVKDGPTNIYSKLREVVLGEASLFSYKKNLGKNPN